MFAYQLLKIDAKCRKGDKIEYDELRHKAAYLSKDYDDETDEENDSLEKALVSAANADTLQTKDEDMGDMSVTELGEGSFQITCISSKY